MLDYQKNNAIAEAYRKVEQTYNPIPPGFVDDGHGHIRKVEVDMKRKTQADFNQVATDLWYHYNPDYIQNPTHPTEKEYSDFVRKHKKEIEYYFKRDYPEDWKWIRKNYKNTK